MADRSSSTTAGLTPRLLRSGRSCPQRAPTSGGEASRSPAGSQPLPAPPEPAPLEDGGAEPPARPAAAGRPARHRPLPQQREPGPASRPPGEVLARGGAVLPLSLKRTARALRPLVARGGWRRPRGWWGGRLGPLAVRAPAAGRSGLAAVGPGAAVRHTGAALRSESPEQGRRYVTGLLLCSHGSEKEASANQRGLSAGPEASPEPRETCRGFEKHL